MSKSVIHQLETLPPAITLDQAFKIRREVNKDSVRKQYTWSHAMQTKAEEILRPQLQKLVHEDRNYEAFRRLAWQILNTTVKFSGKQAETLVTNEYYHKLHGAVKWSLMPERPYKVRNSKLLSINYPVFVDMPMGRNIKGKHTKVAAAPRSGHVYTIRDYLPELHDHNGVRESKHWISLDTLQRSLPQWMLESVINATYTQFTGLPFTVEL